MCLFKENRTCETNVEFASPKNAMEYPELCRLDGTFNPKMDSQN